MLSRTLLSITTCLLGTTSLFASDLVTSEDFGELPANEWAQTFGTDPAQLKNTFSTDGKLQVLLLGAKEPTNILWPGEDTELEVQIANLTDAAVERKAKVVVVAYETWTHDGEIFKYGVRRIAEVGAIEQAINVPAKGVQHLRIKPPIPQQKGGFAVLLEVEGNPNRFFITSLARTFKPAFTKRRFYKLTMDIGDAAVLRRLGAAPNRTGMSPQNPSNPDAEAYYQDQAAKLRTYAEAGLPICIEFGHGAPFFGEMNPLGRHRPSLDDKGVMQGGVGDIVWSPEYDQHFTAFVKRLLIEFGWPKGPINAVKIWNEPWNGGSIAGWAADDDRFREMTIAMDQAVREARAEAGVQVLQGGADSSSNSLDKYFSDGSNRFDPMFDFLSVHYQGNDPHTNWRAWRERKGPDGKPNPVLFWDTESWVGNTDDRVCSVLASMYSFGQDRAVGIQSNRTVVQRWEHPALAVDGKPLPGKNGRPMMREGQHASGVAAAVGAFQELVGEDRRFSKLLWHGLPFVMQFEGKPVNGATNVEDSTFVVLGDMGFFNADGAALRTARSLVEQAGKRELREQLAKLPADAVKERQEIEQKLLKVWPYSGCTMTLNADGDRFGLLDFYGNPIPAVEGRIVVPLSVRGFYLRGDGKPGSVAALTKAIQEARIDGFEPLAKKCHDFTAPIASKPVMRLELRNVLNRPVTGKLSVAMAGLQISYPAELSLAAHEMKTVEVAVTGGSANDANLYPMDLRFDAGNGVVSEHHEDMRVNWISRRSVTIDGKLDDWKDAVPQQIRIEEAAKATMTEKAWKPWETHDEGIKKGFALGYLAWDEQNFYFAAKVADTSPHPGTLRFEKRDDDQYFYPEVSYRKPDPKRQGEGATDFSARWSGFLQSRTTGKHTLIMTTDDGVRVWLDGKPVINDWIGRGATDSKVEVDLKVGVRVPVRIEYFQGGGGGSAVFSWIEPGGERMVVPGDVLYQKADGKDNGLAAEFFAGAGVSDQPKLVRTDPIINYPAWPTLPWVAQVKAADPGLEAMHWPVGMRRYSYRKGPDLPAGNAPNFDNIQIAFNVLPEERKKKISVLPGLITDYMAYSCTDYEWALNKVAEKFGGGTEVWRLRRPDMPHKHFYPRTLKSPADGPAPGAKLVVTYEGGWRITEASIPWSEMPETKARLDAGQTVKFSFRVNDDQGVGCMELSKRRSVAKRNGSFMADWLEHWANELEFGAEAGRK